MNRYQKTKLHAAISNLNAAQAKITEVRKNLEEKFDNMAPSLREMDAELFNEIAELNQLDAETKNIIESIKELVS